MQILNVNIDIRQGQGLQLPVQKNHIWSFIYAINRIFIFIIYYIKGYYICLHHSQIILCVSWKCVDGERWEVWVWSNRWVQGYFIPFVPFVKIINGMWTLILSSEYPLCRKKLSISAILDVCNSKIWTWTEFFIKLASIWILKFVFADSRFFS